MAATVGASTQQATTYGRLNHGAHAWHLVLRPLSTLVKSPAFARRAAVSSGQIYSASLAQIINEIPRPYPRAYYLLPRRDQKIFYSLFFESPSFASPLMNTYLRSQFNLVLVATVHAWD
jgi:hypothetical protein